MPKSPTKREYTALEQAFDWFNRDLFGGQLTPCLITFNRHSKAYGYYWAGKIEGRRGKMRHPMAEIALNPDSFSKRADRQIMSTLVHEMVHHWQYSHGNPGRACYHNREWAAKMIAVGLMPSSTGKPGGHETGDKMSHYIIRDGAFSRAWGKLFHTGFRLRLQSRPASPGKDRSKQKFTCPMCSMNVWGADSLVGCISCVRCNQVLVERE